MWDSLQILTHVQAHPSGVWRMRWGKFITCALGLVTVPCVAAILFTVIASHFGGFHFWSKFLKWSGFGYVVLSVVGLLAGLLLAWILMSIHFASKTNGGHPKTGKDGGSTRVTAEAAIIGPGIEVHSSRPSVTWFRDKLKTANTVWGLWLVGGSAATYNLLDDMKFERVVLLPPGCEVLRSIAILMKPPKEVDSYFAELGQRIRDLTASANQKNERVRWYGGLTSSIITLGNPTSPTDAWAIIEPYLPGRDADERPTIFINRGHYPSLYKSAYDSFLQVWNYTEPSNS